MLMSLEEPRMRFPRLPSRKCKKDLAKSQEALLEARTSLSEVKSRTPEVRAISKALKEIREKNHFAEQLEAIILRNGGTLHQ